MVAKKILVMGVGRSGTTALYCLLQEILEKNVPEGIDYVYEPFLWDRATFNTQFERTESLWPLASSISLEGMYFNKKIPLIVGEDDTFRPEERKFVKSLLQPGGGKTHILCKMIRASGRLRLIQKVCPGTKVIFIIRNPLDVINSSSSLFSFYGDEFYQSDFPRFRENVERVYGKDALSQFSQETEPEKQFLYWYFMNRSFADSYQLDSHNILPILYEDFSNDTESSVKAICNFVGAEYQPDFGRSISGPIGPIQSAQTNISPKVVDYIRDKMGGYEELAGIFGLSVNEGLLEGLLSKYENGNFSQVERKKLENMNSLHAMFRIRECEEQIDQNTRKIETQQLQIAEGILHLEEVSQLLADKERKFSSEIEAQEERFASEQEEHKEEFAKEIHVLSEDLRWLNTRYSEIEEKSTMLESSLSKLRIQADNYSAKLSQLQEEKSDLQSIFLRVSSLWRTSFWKSPLTKYKQYKALLRQYERSKSFKR